jgi:hypothetical protein
VVVVAVAVVVAAVVAAVEAAMVSLVSFVSFNNQHHMVMVAKIMDTIIIICIHIVAAAMVAKVMAIIMVEAINYFVIFKSPI